MSASFVQFSTPPPLWIADVFYVRPLWWIGQNQKHFLELPWLHRQLKIKKSRFCLSYFTLLCNFPLVGSASPPLGTYMLHMQKGEGRVRQIEASLQD